MDLMEIVEEVLLFTWIFSLCPAELVILSLLKMYLSQAVEL